MTQRLYNGKRNNRGLDIQTFGKVTNFTLVSCGRMWREANSDDSQGGSPSADADLQCQSHLRIDVVCIGAQGRERHAEETNSFAHRKLRRE